MNQDSSSTTWPPATTGELTTLPRLAVAVMEAVEFGLIVCRTDGHLLQANRAARREIGPDAPLKLHGGCLSAAGLAEAIGLAGALEDAGRGIRRMLRLGSPEDPLSVVSVPLSMDDGPPVSALLVLGRRAPCSSLSLEMLALRHGLTLAEKRVLSGLLGTREPKQIAREHGVQLSTVRSQIQSIRGKLGVRSIDELLVRVAQLPAVAACAA